MRLFDDNPPSLSGLAAPDFLQFDHSFSSSASSSLTAHCRSSCATSTCMRVPTRRSQKFPQPSPVIAAENYPSSSSHSSDLFKPLPPIPKTSSFHFSVIWSIYANSPSVLDVSPQIPTRNSTLYDSSIGATDGNHMGNATGVMGVSGSPRAIYFSTDPYSPWPSPVRRHFMSRSDGSFSRVSRYSRPESRSGARAPDPPSRRTSLGTTGCDVPGVRRVRRFARNFRLFAQRMCALRTLLRNLRRKRPMIPPTSTVLHRRTSTRASTISSITSFVPSRSVRTSMSSALTNTLQRWLEARNQPTQEKASDHAPITISQYERKGSWLADDWCGLRNCDVHPPPPQPPSESTASQSILSIHAEPLTGKYVSVSLRAGEEASRRRKRSLDRTAAWTGSDFGSNLLEYR